MIRQHGSTPFEAFTINDLFQDKIEEWKTLVTSADPTNRTFTYSDFKNGKVIIPDLSDLMWNRIKTFLPDEYEDARGKIWRFIGVTKYVMYAQIKPGKCFPIHTDTGADYSRELGRESKFTVLIYLNTDFQGGNTQFYDETFQKTFHILPECGKMLAFDIDLFHGGMPVDEGTKMWIGTELVCERRLGHE